MFSRSTCHSSIQPTRATPRTRLLSTYRAEKRYERVGWARQPHRRKHVPRLVNDDPAAVAFEADDIQGADIRDAAVDLANGPRLDHDVLVRFHRGDLLRLQVIAAVGDARGHAQGSVHNESVIAFDPRVVVGAGCRQATS